MPIIMKPNKVKFKDPEKQGFIELNSIAETSTEEFLDRINNVADSALNNISTAADNANKQAATLDSKVELISNSIASVQTYGVDDTLTVSHAAADAKVVGTQINTINTLVIGENQPLISIAPSNKSPDGVQDNIIIRTTFSIIQTNGKSILRRTEGAAGKHETLKYPIDISNIPPGAEISLSSSLSAEGGAYIVDENNVILKYINGYSAYACGGAPAALFYPINFTVPKNAKYVIATMMNSGKADALLKSELSDYTIRYRNKNNIQKLKDILNKIIIQLNNEQLISNITWTDGYKDENNNIQPNTDYCYSNLIDITGYKKIKIKYLYYPNMSTINDMAIIILDQNQSIIKTFVTNKNANNYFTPLIAANGIQIPQEAKFIIISQYKKARNYTNIIGSFNKIDQLITYKSILPLKTKLENLTDDDVFIL